VNFYNIYFLPLLSAFILILAYPRILLLVVNLQVSSLFLCFLLLILQLISAAYNAGLFFSFMKEGCVTHDCDLNLKLQWMKQGLFLELNSVRSICYERTENAL